MHFLEKPITLFFVFILKVYLRFFGRNAILCFHSISNRGMTKFKFEILIRTLKSIGYDFPVPNDIDKLSRKGNIIVSFDDGYADNLKVTDDVLHPLGIKPIIFVVTQLLKGNIKEKSNYGLKNIKAFSFEDALNFKDKIHFGFHTDLHVDLYEFNTKSGDLSSLIQGDAEFELLLNSGEKKFFAYPFGYLPCDKDEFVNLLLDLGYSHAFTTKWGKVNLDTPFYINRVVIGDNDSLLRGLLKISGLLDIYSKFKWSSKKYG